LAATDWRLWRWRLCFLALSNAWHSCRVGCIVFSENPQGLATHFTYIIPKLLYILLRHESTIKGFGGKNAPFNKYKKTKKKTLLEVWKPNGEVLTPMYKVTLARRNFFRCDLKIVHT